MTHITCRLTAKNQDQLWNPTLYNQVWATFYLYYFQLLVFVLLDLFNQPSFLDQYQSGHPKENL